MRRGRRKIKRRLRWIVAILVALAVGVGGYLHTSGAELPGLLSEIQSQFGQRAEANRDTSGVLEVAVNRVVDGDTAIFTNATGEELRVRFIGVDAPEANEPGGAEATAFTQQHLYSGRVVWLEIDENRPTDRFGRTRAYVWLANPADGAEVRKYMLNALLIYSGNAKVSFLSPSSYEDVLNEIEQER